MTYVPKNPNGQATSANSEPVVIASDQSEVPVGDATTHAKLDTIHADLLAIDGHVDGLETLVGLTNTALATLHTDLATTLHNDLATTIAGYVDGLEALAGTGNSDLAQLHNDLATTIAGYVDGIEGALATGNTNTAGIRTDLTTTIAGYVDGVEGLLTSVHADVDGVEGLLTSLRTDLTTTIGGYVDGLEGLVTTSNTNLATLHTDLGHLTDGTQTVKGATTSGTLQSGATGTGNGSSLDVTGMGSVTFTVTISATATVTFEASEDSTNGTDGTWAGFSTTTIGGSFPSTASASNQTRVGAVGAAKYVRARISSYGSGTVTVTAHASAVPPIPTNLSVQGPTASGSNPAGYNPVQVAGNDGTNVRTLKTDTSGNQLVGGDVAAAATDSGNPVKVGGKYNSTLPTYTDGQRGDAQIGTRGSLNVQLMAANSTGVIGNRSYTADGITSGTTIDVAAFLYMWNGGNVDRVRTPNVFKTANASGSGNTTVWTPNSGKKFRLMGYTLDVPMDVALSGGGAEFTMLFKDSGTDVNVGHRIFVPQTAKTDTPGGWSITVSLGNGVLSSAANNVLQIALSATLTTGNVRVVAWGTEE